MYLRPTSNAAADLKICNPLGLSNGGSLAALLLSHRALRLCSFVASGSCRTNDPPLLSAPSSIYEMGSGKWFQIGFDPFFSGSIAEKRFARIVLQRKILFQQLRIRLEDGADLKIGR